MTNHTDRTGLYILIIIMIMVSFIYYVETWEHLKEMMKLIRDINYETYNEKSNVTNYEYQEYLFK